MKLNKSNLNVKWTNAITVAQLLILTIKEMRNCNIKYNKSSKQLSDPKPLTAKLVRKTPVSDRGHFLEDFPTFDKLYEKVKVLAESNETWETVEAKVQPGYTYPGSCWLCRICLRKEGSHKSNSCPLLKTIFTLYLFLRPPVCRRAISTNTCSGTKIK